MLKKLISSFVLGLSICTVCSCKENAKETAAQNTKKEAGEQQEESADSRSGFGGCGFHTAADRRKEIAKKIWHLGNALIGFRTQYAKFPCDATAENERLQNRIAPFGELQGSTSNCYLRQLFARKGAVEEKDFYANVGKEYREGDEQIFNGACLELGENIFAYVVRMQHAPMGSKKTQQAKVSPVLNSNIPLLIYGIKHDGATPIRGDELEFEEEAVIFYADGSLRRLHNGQTESGAPIFPVNPRTGISTAADYFILPPAL